MARPLDPRDDLARVLRTRYAEAFRVEAEEAEHDARLLAWRSRTMTQVAHELMTTGRHVAIEVGDTRLVGAIVHTGTNLAVLHEPPAAPTYVDLSGPIVLQPLDRQGPGRPGDPAHPGSFPAALRKLELSGETVSLHLVRGHIAEATITAVTPDHVRVEAGSTTRHVSRSLISAVALVQPVGTT